MVAVKGSVKMKNYVIVFIVSLLVCIGQFGLCTPLANEANNSAIVKERYHSGISVYTGTGYGMPYANIGYPPPPPPSPTQPIRRRPIAQPQFYQPMPIMEVRTIMPYPHNMNYVNNFGYYNPYYGNGYYRQTRIIAPHSIIRMGF